MNHQFSPRVIEALHRVDGLARSAPAPPQLSEKRSPARQSSARPSPRKLVASVAAAVVVAAATVAVVGQSGGDIAQARFPVIRAAEGVPEFLPAASCPMATRPWRSSFEHSNRSALLNLRRPATPSARNVDGASLLTTVRLSSSPRNDVLTRPRACAPVGSATRGYPLNMPGRASATGRATNARVHSRQVEHRRERCSNRAFASLVGSSKRIDRPQRDAFAESHTPCRPTLRPTLRPILRPTLRPKRSAVASSAARLSWRLGRRLPGRRRRAAPRRR